MIMSWACAYTEARLNNDRHIIRCAALFAIVPIIIPTLINLLLWKLNDDIIFGEVFAIEFFCCPVLQRRFKREVFCPVLRRRLISKTTHSLDPVQFHSFACLLRYFPLFKPRSPCYSIISRVQFCTGLHIKCETLSYGMLSSFDMSFVKCGFLIISFISPDLDTRFQLF